MTSTAAYGTWHSPISAKLLVESAVGLSDLSYRDGTLYWLEARPEEQGRRVVVRLDEHDEPFDLFAAPFSARTFVHEYGGRCYECVGDVCYFTNQSDQAIYSVRPGQAPERLTASPRDAEQVSFADFVASPDKRRLYAVRERHGAYGPDGEAGTVNDLVVVRTDTGEVERLCSGHDFYGAPRLSPDGRRLAFLAWDHPNMPWDMSALYVVDPDHPDRIELVDGGPGYAISQPRFDGAGTLYYLSDQTGYLSIYNERDGLVVDVGEDLGGPDWVFGQSSYLPRDDAILAVRGGERLGAVRDGSFEDLPGPYAVVSYLTGAGEKVAAIVASPTSPAAIARFNPDGGNLELLRKSRPVPVGEAFLSVPEELRVAPGTDEEVHAFYYPPTNPDFAAPKGELAPLIVESHGGPTSKSLPSFNLQIQYATSRGFGVVQVNYGGSSGYGRAYRERLVGNWGVVDVKDCVAVAQHLVALGKADGGRLLIRGSSAGGFTTLAALCFTDAFAAGASYYGVADLLLLARDTHKFESRYLDRLVGPLPECAPRYAERSPLAHADKITAPVIFFQGLDDPIVPPNQAEAMVGALVASGVPVAYVPFAGERHGFQRAETIIEAAESELCFYRRVLHLDLAEELRPLQINNAQALDRNER